MMTTATVTDAQLSSLEMTWENMRELKDSMITRLIEQKTVMDVSKF